MNHVIMANHMINLITSSTTNPIVYRQFLPPLKNIYLLSGEILQPLCYKVYYLFNSKNSCLNILCIYALLLTAEHSLGIVEF